MILQSKIISSMNAYFSIRNFYETKYYIFTDYAHSFSYFTANTSLST